MRITFDPVPSWNKTAGWMGQLVEIRKEGMYGEPEEGAHG